MAARRLRALGFMLAILGLQTACSSGSKHSGLHVITQNGKSGFIDGKGKVVINPQFEGANDFTEGLAMVQIGQKSGYINTKGEFVVNPQYDLAMPFSGRAGGSQRQCRLEELGVHQQGRKASHQPAI